MISDADWTPMGEYIKPSLLFQVDTAVTDGILACIHPQVGREVRISSLKHSNSYACGGKVQK